MNKINKNIKYLLLIICSLLVASISWASSGSGAISAFFTSMTASTIESSQAACYIACLNSDTCPRWTRTCKKCTNYKDNEYCNEVKPVAPDSLNATEIGLTTVTLTWSPVLNAASYIIYIGSSPTSMYQAGTSLGTTFKYSILDADTKYNFAVASKNAAGTSEKCDPISIVTSILASRTNFKIAGLDKYNDLVIEAYLSNGKLAGSYRASNLSSATDKSLVENLKLNTGNYQIKIKDRSSGKLIGSRTLTMMLK